MPEAKKTYSDEEYKRLLAEEARIWSKGSGELLASLGGPPTWDTLQKTMYNRVYRGEFWQKALNFARPGMNILEIGCTTGWFSIELWRRGANVDAIDIAEGSLKIARDYYDHVQKAEQRSNNVRFLTCDANFIDENPELRKEYDLIYVNGTFHHLAYLSRTIEGIKARMHKDSVLVCIDTGVPFSYQYTINALSALFIKEVALHAVRLVRGVGRLLRALIDPRYAHDVVHAHAFDGSPFEGVTEGPQIEKALSDNFTALERQSFEAFISSVATPFDAYPVRVRNKVVTPLIALNRLDKYLIRSGIARGNLMFGAYKRRD